MKTKAEPQLTQEAQEIQRIFELGRELYRVMQRVGPRMLRDEREDLLAILNSIAEKGTRHSRRTAA